MNWNILLKYNIYNWIEIKIGNKEGKERKKKSTEGKKENKNQEKYVNKVKSLIHTKGKGEREEREQSEPSWDGRLSSSHISKKTI